LAAAGIVGGFATLLGAHSIERFGGIVGGIFGTIPLTIIPFIIGLLFFETADRVDLTLNMVPGGMTGTMVILLMWRFIPPHLPRQYSSHKRLLLMLLVSFLAWVAVASGVATFMFFMVEIFPQKQQPWDITLAVGVAFFFVYIFASIIFVGIPRLPVGRKGDEVVTLWHHLGRFAVGWTMTTVSVVIARYNIFAGGVSIAFPSVSLPALASLWMIHSDTVAMSAASPMIVGSASISLFAILFAWANPILELEYGKIPGTVVTFASTWYFVIFIYSLPCAVILRAKEMRDTDIVERIIINQTSTTFGNALCPFPADSTEDETRMLTYEPGEPID